MALKIIKTSDLEEILTCNDESFLTITQKISEDNFISNKMQIKNLPLNNYYKKADIDELLKTYSKTTHNHDFNSLSNLPTTLSGYGITDVYTKTEINNKNFLTEHQDISGKQNKLKAGTNITISDDNTISANGVKINDTKKDTTTTYSSSKIETIKSELQQSIDNVSTGGSTALTNYYTKAESDDKYSLINHNHDSVYVKQDGSTPITERVQMPRGSYAHEAVGAGISGNWMLIAEINIKSDNINQPLEFNIVGRNRQTSVTLWILFEATNGTDPGLVSFKCNNTKGYQAYLVKKATSTWSLYINKSEPYDFLDIIDVHIPKYTSTVVTYKSTTVSILPEGGTYASPVQHAISDITNLQTTLDSKAPIKYVSQFEGGAISSKFRKTIIGTTDMCGFVKSFRKNDNTDACMPQHGSGVAWGQADTHGMLYVDYSNPTAYVAGGNGNKLNWYKKLAWKDDLTSYLPLSGGNLTGDLVLNAESEQRLIFNNCSKSKLQTYFYKGNSTDSLTIIGLWDPTNKEPIWKVNNDWSFEVGKQTTFSKKVILNNALQVSGKTTAGDITAQAINVGNNCPIRGRETSNGLYKTLVYMNSQNQVVLGSGSNSVTIQIPALDKLAIWDDATKKSYSIYHSGNDPWRIKTLGKKDMDTTLNSRGQGFLMKEAYNGTSSGYPKEYGNVLRMGGTGSNELLFEWCDGTAGMIYHRCLRDVGTSWTPWRRLAYADELNSYLPKSGGTMKGELALTQDKGIVSANSEGGTLLVETSSSVNVGKIIKSLNLNCSCAYMNGARLLTQYNYMNYMKNIFNILFERNNGTINKNINTCFNSGTFTAPEAGQYLVMCSGYVLTNSSMYIACAVSGTSGNQNMLYTAGSSGFTIITLSAKQTLTLYECPAGNINNDCISSYSYVNMLIAKIL